MSVPIYWIEQYPKKKPEHLDSFQTCVIDGYCWRVSPSGRTYCAGKLEDLKEELNNE